MPLEDPVSGWDDFSKPPKGPNGVVCPILVNFPRHSFFEDGSVMLDFAVLRRYDSTSVSNLCVILGKVNIGRMV